MTITNTESQKNPELASATQELIESLDKLNKILPYDSRTSITDKINETFTLRTRKPEHNTTTLSLSPDNIKQLLEENGDKVYIHEGKNGENSQKLLILPYITEEGALDGHIQISIKDFGNNESSYFSQKISEKDGYPSVQIHVDRSENIQTSVGTQGNRIDSEDSNAADILKKAMINPLDRFVSREFEKKTTKISIEKDRNQKKTEATLNAFQ